MTDLTKIKWLHVEATTRCNAHCPACIRNNNGYGVRSDLDILDLKIERLNEVIDMLPNLESIQLCGNEGDIIAAKNVTEIIDLIISKKITFLQIHTNGSLKTTEWWAALGDKLKNVSHDVWFALDGLEDTHSIYRQGTNYNKIIENAKAFIAAGGTATWQFIPFEHNQHQLKKCMALSQKLGFKNFKLVKGTRIRAARNYKTGEPYDLKNYDLSKKFNRYDIDNSEKTVTVKDCMFLNFNSLFLTAGGKLSICCYMPYVDYTDTSFENDILSGNPKAACIALCGTKK